MMMHQQQQQQQINSNSKTGSQNFQKPQHQTTNHFTPNNLQLQNNAKSQHRQVNSLLYTKFVTKFSMTIDIGIRKTLIKEYLFNFTFIFYSLYNNNRYRFNYKTFIRLCHISITSTCITRVITQEFYCTRISIKSNRHTHLIAHSMKLPQILCNLIL